MQHARDWDRLTSLATLGVARGPGELPAPPHESFVLPESSDPARAVLRNAAATFLWRLAGERAPAGPIPAITQDADERLIRAAAMRRLGRMLADEPRELVPEWLALAARTGAVVPPAWVPAVFEALEPSLRSQHAGVFGLSLQRLAALDERWKVAASTRDGDEADRWANGTADERISALTSLRARDAAHGRELVLSTWDVDPPEVRERALTALLTGLSIDDEALLEQGLDDRRKPVRSAAAEALGRLRHSACVQRACARLEPHFVLQPRSIGLPGRFAGRKLEVLLPNALDKQAQRDGLEPKPPATLRIGERAWWLRQMLAAVPPDVHVTRFDCTAEELLEAARGTDYAADILEALTTAAVRWHAEEWIAPLAEAARRQATASDSQQGLARTLATLLQIPDRPARSTFLLAQVDAMLDQELWSQAFEVLAQVDADWTAELTRSALRVLGRQVASDAQRWAAPRTALEGWARKADPDTAEPLLLRLLQELPAEAPWHKAVARMHDLILFRIEMRKELSA